MSEENNTDLVSEGLNRNSDIVSSEDNPIYISDCELSESYKQNDISTEENIEVNINNVYSDESYSQSVTSSTHDNDTNEGAESVTNIVINKIHNECPSEINLINNEISEACIVHSDSGSCKSEQSDRKIKVVINKLLL